VAGFLPPVIAVLGASIGEFTAKMGEARTEMRTTEGSFAQAGALGKGALLGIGLVAAGVGYESVKMAAGFDQAMEMVHTQAGASQQEVDKLKGSVLALAPAVGIGPETLATGLYHIESAGFRGSQAMDILTASSKLSQIGQSDFETTAQAVVGVMASQIKGVKDAADAGNLLNTTVGMGDMKMQQLAEAIGTGILPKAAAAGLSFEDVGAALATLTDNVTPANEAATRLGMTFSLMSAPTAKAQKAYESIGMTSTQMANDMRGPGGLSAALTDLQNHLNKTYPAGQGVKLSLQEQATQMKVYSDSLTAMGVPLDQQTTMLNTFKGNLEKTGSAAVKQSGALSAMFGGGKSSGTMLTLLGEMDRFKSKTEQYGTAASRAAQAQEAWKSQQGQFSQQIKQIGAALDVWGVKLGNVLIPYLQKFIGWITTGATWLGRHKIVLLGLGIALGALVIGLAAATIATIEWNTVLLANPIVWIAAGIAAAVALITIGIIELIKHWSAVWGEIKRIAGDVLKFFEKWWPLLLAPFTGGLSLLVGLVVDHWHQILDFLKGIWGDITGFFTGAWHDVVDPIVGAWRWLERTTSEVWGRITAFFRRWWPLILAIFFPEIYGLLVLWKHFHQDIEDTAKTVWNGIKDFFGAIWNGIKDVAAGVWVVIRDTIIVPVQATWDFIEKLWTMVSSWIAKKWDDLRVVAGIVWNKIHDTIIAPVVQVWSDATTWFDKIGTAVSSAWNSVLNFIGTIAGKIGSAFADAGTWLWDAGVKIVEGLVNGIKSVFGTVKNALVGLATSIVSWKGPPEKDAILLWGNGQLLMQGLMGGIGSKAGDLKAQLAGVAGSVAGTFATAGSGMGGMPLGGGVGGGSATGGGVNVYVTVQGSVHSDAGVAKVVRQEVLRYQQRNSRSNLALSGFGG
jgi:phage-related protein